MPTIYVMTETERLELHTLMIRKQTAERMLAEVHAAEGIFWRALGVAHSVPSTIGYSVESKSGVFGPAKDVEAFIIGLTKEAP